jgi:DHA2 family multidrug resistance protein
MLATLMEVLDTSIVNVAMPDMMGNMGATLSEIGWVSTGYIVANVIVLPLTGWLSDFFGRKRYLTYSIILFTVASFGCGISRTLPEIVLWRILQGAGGAAFLSTSQATLIEVYPPAKRGLAQAIFGIGVIMAPTLGPTLGGIITDRYSWPWIFFINLPIGVLAGVLTMLYVPNSAAAGKKRAADFLGIILLAIGLGCLQTVLEQGESNDWFSDNFIVLLTIFAISGLAAFVWWQLHPKNASPAVNLRILANRNLAMGAMYAFILGFALYGVVFVVPQFLQNVQRHTAEQTGWILMPGGIASAFTMPIVGQLSNRVDRRYIIGAGMIIFLGSMYQFQSRLTLTMPEQAMYWPLVLRGAGIGLQFVPLSLLALGTLQPRQVAEGAGIYNLFRQLGGSFGIALLATLVDRRMQFHDARLSESISLYNPATQERLNQIQTGMAAHGMTPDAAQKAAYQVINKLVQGQAAVLTYIDVFHTIAYVGFAGLVMLFFFKRVKAAPGGASAAH